MSESRKIDLRALFGDLQAELEGRLGTARRNLTHPGAKGDVTESEWASLLGAYLPRRYAVTKGFVVDSQGSISDEIDIIIHDRHFSPLLFHHAQTCYVPAESVYAVLEVKPELSREHLCYAGNKAASVRRLLRTSAVIPHAGGKYEPRVLPQVIAGLLASSSAWSPPDSGLKATFADFDPENRINLGCSARDVAFRASYELAGGVANIELSGPNQALVFFLLHLLGDLQAMASVPAIDYGAYLHSLGGREP